ncbi:MAG TPA: amidohydrolase family protein [Myxococcaceae bacterium]|nr:amidohydrolase family protein [Myxococcaceae bacterium]
MRIVDAHTHLLPGRLGRAIRAYFTQAIPPESFPYAPEPELAHAALRAAGVARCWSLPYVRRAGSAHTLNRWMAETWRSDPLVEPAGTVHPGDDVTAVVDEALALDLRLFKLHCAVGDFSLGDERLGPLWARVSDRGFPVVVHLGHSPLGPTEPDELATLERVATAWPEARIVLAHLAAPSVQEALEMLHRHPSLHADLTPVLFHPVPVRPGDLAGMTEKILFGSDLPSLGLPFAEVVAHVRGLGLTPEEEQAVFAGNADRLVPPRHPAGLTGS